MSPPLAADNAESGVIERVLHVGKCIELKKLLGLREGLTTCVEVVLEVKQLLLEGSLVGFGTVVRHEGWVDGEVDLEVEL